MGQRHVLIVGGTSGAGREMVRLAANDGDRVSVIGRKPIQAADIVTPEVQGWQVDLQNLPELTKVLKEIIADRGPLSSLVFYQRYRGQGDSWQGEIDISLNATRTVIEELQGCFADDGGAITIIGSVAGNLIAAEQPLSYHLGKAGIEQIVRYYAVVLGPKGIRVNAVSPSTIVKEESQHFYDSNPQLVELYQKITPLGRLCCSKDIAEAVKFLSSPSATFMTGQNLLLDGGISLQWHESMARQLTPLKDLRVTRDANKEGK